MCINGQQAKPTTEEALNSSQELSASSVVNELVNKR